MKLLEIAFKQVQPKYGSNAYGGKIIPHKLPKQLQPIGAGMEAVVFQNKRPSSQGVIIKTIDNCFESYDQNGTIQYLIRGNNANNLLIPIVYEIKQIQVGKTYTYTIKMEKLSHITDNDFDDPLLCEALLHSILEPINSTKPVTFPDVETFGEFVSDAIRFGDTISLFEVDRTINKSAKQLRQLLTDIHQQTRYDFDIHDDNIMIRRTSVGAQLVITDPLWGAL